MEQTSSFDTLFGSGPEMSSTLQRKVNSFSTSVFQQNIQVQLSTFANLSETVVQTRYESDVQITQNYFSYIIVNSGLLASIIELDACGNVFFFKNCVYKSGNINAAAESQSGLIYARVYPYCSYYTRFADCSFLDSPNGMYTRTQLDVQSSNFTLDTVNASDISQIFLTFNCPELDLPISRVTMVTLASKPTTPGCLLSVDNTVLFRNVFVDNKCRKNFAETIPLIYYKNTTILRGLVILRNTFDILGIPIESSTSNNCQVFETNFDIDPGPYVQVHTLVNFSYSYKIPYYSTGLCEAKYSVTVLPSTPSPTRETSVNDNYMENSKRILIITTSILAAAVVFVIIWFAIKSKRQKTNQKYFTYDLRNDISYDTDYSEQRANENKVESKTASINDGLTHATQSDNTENKAKSIVKADSISADTNNIKIPAMHRRRRAQTPQPTTTAHNSDESVSIDTSDSYYYSYTTYTTYESESQADKP